MVKFQRLQELYPNVTEDFNLLYLGSSSPPPDMRVLLWLARRRSARVVWNQNGVAYPGWAGADTERVNASMRRALRQADHVFYQSEFCKISADAFLGPPVRSWGILHNAVDTARFVPDGHARSDTLALLLGGNQYQRYRFETALQTLALLRDGGEDVELRVSGSLSWRPDLRAARREADELVEQLGLEGRVQLVGTYTQADAPAVIASADLLLHTKYNDPCPTIVLEAMACGLPVVYSSSGGTPELVGNDAGVGVDAPLDWERDHPPDPQALADAVCRVAGSLGDYAKAARERAAQFDLIGWIARHEAVFAELLR